MTHITMSAKEIDRFAVINNLVDGIIKGSEAAKQLGMSTWQVGRLKKRFNKDNPKSMVHRGRGKTSNRKLKQIVLDTIIQFMEIGTN